MNRSSSSKLAKKASPAPAAMANKKKTKKKKKEEMSPRNPLQDLNASRISTSNSNSNNGSEASSSISVEAPRGCLRFFLSHASNSKTPICMPKTPKSAPVVRPSKSKENRSNCSALANPEKPLSRNVHKLKNNSACLYQWQSGNKPTTRNDQKLKTCASVLNSNGNSLSKAQRAGQPTEQLKPGRIAGNFTPLSKIATGLGLESETIQAEEGNVLLDNSNKSSSTTPPIQASVSPEIQCVSSAVSTSTIACYAAGHILSGISDKRKCRSRGILNVGENDSGFSKGKAFGSFEDEDGFNSDQNGKGVVCNLDASMDPLPTEASMHWLLSPCNEEDEDHKEHKEDGFHKSVGFVSLHGDVCKNTSTETTANCCRRSTSISANGIFQSEQVLEPLNDLVPVFSSPHCTPGPEDLTMKDEREYHYDDIDGNSPFSMLSLDSGNVIRTPQSDSSVDNHRKHYFDSELSSVAEAIRMATLSPKNHTLIEDQFDSSFQFDCLTTTCNSISQFQKVLEDRDSWVSNASLENVSLSEMRISWREGLMSRMYDMDEYDCCRCLSDEEEEIIGCSNDPLKKPCQSPELNINGDEDDILTYSSGAAKVLDESRKVEEKFPPESSCPCAESISIDGGDLLASGDSDWSLCYKNELFHSRMTNL